MGEGQAVPTKNRHNRGEADLLQTTKTPKLRLRSLSNIILQRSILLVPLAEESPQLVPPGS